ncbi:MAG: ATP-binding cassette domain-containing protein [Candidatus Syntrophonatronum acetioxidans]|uniref:ABC transporter ATP-binding protein n=1 Tax=Candidatus Syntrophonatronum acetioxidans TaxID=1795816 RepID=A0A424YGP9_9FIRM|nr:MAG: ATP-binding cassette domain-containing protein [Candidatus Syntrophonatronum acetioxidans]
MKAVEIRNLSYTYPDGTPALKDINVDILPHKRTVILGANGSGKTTLIYHLNGIFFPQEGKVTIGGLPLEKKNLEEIRRKLGLLFDNPDNQLFSTTVYNDIAFGPRNLKLGEEEVEERVLRVLEAIGIKDLKERPPYNLSLGQKKKVAIAGLLAMEPEILVCDEPFSGLDPRSGEQLMGIINSLNSRGTTLVIVTHDVNMAYAWGEQVVIMKEGKILQEGDPSLLREEDLMKEASLETPLLVDVFQGTGFYPRTAREASRLIKFGLKEAYQEE